MTLFFPSMFTIDNLSTIQEIVEININFISV